MTSSGSITVSLEMAKKLKEAVWEQEDSTFYWASGKRHAEWVCVYDGHCDKAITNNAGYGEPPWTYYLSDIDGGNEYSNDDKIVEKYAAPTAEEILRNLPYSISWKDDSDNIAVLFISKFPSSYRVGYSPQWTKDAWSTPDSESLADAAAACWCYLKENNLLV